MGAFNAYFGGFLALVVYLNVIYCAILRVGTPLPWIKSKPYLNYIRLTGAKQFLEHYKRCEGFTSDGFFWGDEIEYGLFQRSPGGHFDLFMNATILRENLANAERTYIDLPIGCEWQPEYGSWMIESVPRNPYGNTLGDLLNVEKSLLLRRKRMHYMFDRSSKHNNEDISSSETKSKSIIAPSISCFPMLGVQGYGHAQNVLGDVCMSNYVSDAVINPHPRFGTLTRNIRERRGRRVNITLGVDAGEDAAPQYEHMDAMAFGMGSCCLQVTMQCDSEESSRFLSDQLTIVSPLLLALSAATPFMKGRVLSSDTRWAAIEKSVDDRTLAEEGGSVADAPYPLPDASLAGQGVRQLRKSRYSSMSTYLKKCCGPDEERRLQALLTPKPEIDEEVFQLLREGGVDESMSTHIAHLFTRDPLVIFSDSVDGVPPGQKPSPHSPLPPSLEHFENIQSTNWRTIRWKPPSVRVGLDFQQNGGVGAAGAGRTRTTCDHNILVEDRESYVLSPSPAEADASPPLASLASSQASSSSSSTGPGWRVEFRPLEVQLTDFENAAFAIAVVLLSRALLEGAGAGRMDFYLPLHYVEENMRRAQLKDACLRQKFFMRRNIFSGSSSGAKSIPCVPAAEDIEVAELTLDEIFNGEKASGNAFPGLLPLIDAYLASSSCCTSAPAIDSALKSYLSVLQGRAKGALPTPAHFLRRFVTSHPLYEGGGVIPAALADELLLLCEDIGMGRKHVPELYGERGGGIMHMLVGDAGRGLQAIEEEDLMFSNYTCSPPPPTQTPLTVPLPLPRSSLD